MASLKLASPGDVNFGVTQFFPQKADDRFSHRAQNVMTFFGHRHHSFSPRLPSDRFSSTLCKIQQQKILLSSGCHSPLDGVTRGGPPSSDATWQAVRKISCSVFTDFWYMITYSRTARERNAFGDGIKMQNYAAFPVPTLSNFPASVGKTSQI